MNKPRSTARFLGVALFLTLVIGAWLALAHGQSTQPAGMRAAAGAQPAAPSTPQSLDSSEGAVPSRSVPLVSREIVGRLLWSDRVPIANARVGKPDRSASTVTDANGLFRLRMDLEPECSAVDLTVQPGCWCTPSPWIGVAVSGSLEPPNDAEAVLVLPAETDVRLCLAIGEAAATIVRRVGLDRVRATVFRRDRPVAGVQDEITEFFEKRITMASVDLALADLPTTRVVRVPMHEVIEVSTAFDAPPPSDQLGGVSAPTIRLVVDRRSVPEAAPSLETRHLLAGRVVDQQGQPVSACKVRLPKLGPRLGPLLTYTGDDGYFVASGAPGDTHVVWANYENVLTERVNVPVGTVDVELRCSMASLRRVMVKCGRQAVQRFELKPRSMLFGAYDWPRLASRPDGVIWLPPKREAEPRYLCWHNGSALQEVPILVPAIDDDPTFEIDVAGFAVEPRGVLRIEHAPGVPAVAIQLVAPAPPHGFRPLRATALPWKEGPLLGILAGTYEVSLQTNPFHPPSASARIELCAGENRLSVADIQGLR